MPKRGSLGSLDKPVQPVNSRLLSLLVHVMIKAAELWRSWRRLGTCPHSFTHSLFWVSTGIKAPAP